MIDDILVCYSFLSPVWFSASEDDDGLLSSGFMAGKKRTSLMLLESVRNIARRSMPMPQPPVGGRLKVRRT